MLKIRIREKKLWIHNTAWKEGPASHPPHVSRHCRTASSRRFFGVFDAAVVDVAFAAVADAVAAAAVADADAVAAAAAAVVVAAVADAADTTGRCFECLPAKPEPENYLQEDVRYGSNSAHSACFFEVPVPYEQTTYVNSIRYLGDEFNRKAIQNLPDHSQTTKNMHKTCTG